MVKDDKAPLEVSIPWYAITCLDAGRSTILTVSTATSPSMAGKPLSSTLFGQRCLRVYFGDLRNEVIDIV